jgi:hypothetical protein
MGVKDTNDDGNERDKKVEVTDDDGEEEFDGDAFSVLLAAGKADYLGKGKYQRGSQQSSRTQHRGRQSQRDLQRAANGCIPLTSYFPSGPTPGK